MSEPSTSSDWRAASRRARLESAGASPEVVEAWATTWLPNTPPPGKTTAIYRHLTIDNQLLYLGKSRRPGLRQTQHLKQSPWVIFAAQIVVEWFATKEEAAIVEITAITNEKPLFNHEHNDYPETRARLNEFLTERGRPDLIAQITRKKLKPPPAAEVTLSTVLLTAESDPVVEATQAMGKIVFHLEPFKIALDAKQYPELAQFLAVRADPHLYMNEIEARINADAA